MKNVAWHFSSTIQHDRRYFLKFCFFFSIRRYICLTKAINILTIFFFLVYRSGYADISRSFVFTYVPSPLYIRYSYRSVLNVNDGDDAKTKIANGKPRQRWRYTLTTYANRRKNATLISTHVHHVTVRGISYYVTTNGSSSCRVYQNENRNKRTAITNMVLL